MLLELGGIGLSAVDEIKLVLDRGLPIVLEEASGVSGVRIERPVELNRNMYLLDTH